jgi:hypothetical protein
MTAIAASLRDVTIVQGPFDQALAGTDYRVVAAYIDSNGVTVTGGSDTLDLATAGAAIAGFIRDGKTYTPRSVSLLQPYRSGSSNVFGTVAMISVGLWMMWPFSLNCAPASTKLIVANTRMLTGRPQKLPTRTVFALGDERAKSQKLSTSVP